MVSDLMKQRCESHEQARGDRGLFCCILFLSLIILSGCDTDLHISTNQVQSRDVIPKYTTNEPIAEDPVDESAQLSELTPADVCSTISFTNSRGELIQGEADCSSGLSDPNLVPENIRSGITIGGVSGSQPPVPAACATEGETACLTNSNFPAIETASLAPKVAAGKNVAGVLGSYTGGLVGCSNDGDVGCVTAGNLKAADTLGAADKILSGQTLAGVAGNVTLPAVGHVLTGTSYGVGGTGSTGSLTVPAVTSVLSGSGAYGNPTTPLTPIYTPDFPEVGNVLSTDSVNGVAGTLTLPSTNNVRTINGTYGVGGSGSTPALANCNTDGDTGCVAMGPTIAAAMITGAADKILFGQTLGGINGNVHLPTIGKVLSGTTYGINGTGLTGTLTLPLASNVLFGSGAYGDPDAAITPTLVPDFPSAGNVLNMDTVNGVTGTLTLPDVSKVLTGTTYGASGNGSTGTLTLPLAANVLTGSGAYGDPESTVTPAYTPDFPEAENVLSTDTVDGAPGTLTLPTVGKVLLNTTYGVASNISTGTLTLPSAGNVLSGSGTYGDPGAAVTPAYTPDFPLASHVLNTDTVDGVAGTLTLPAAANVRVINGAFGVGGNGTTPTLANCSAGNQSGCVTTDTYKTMNLASAGTATGLTASNFNATIATNTSFEFWDASGARHTVTGDNKLSIGNVRNSVTIFGVTGQYPSASYRLDNDTGIPDFTLFATQLTTDGDFEFFDSTGARYTGSGDSDLVDENIKNGVEFENLSIVGSLPGGSCSYSTQASCIADTACRWSGTACEINPWHIRAGVTIEGQTGSLKLNCRNRMNSSVFNTDAIPPGTSGTTAGTSRDWWDTIDPSNNGGLFPSSTVTGWNSNTECGLEVWEDLTSGGCTSAAKDCIMKDNITGLMWSESYPVTGQAPTTTNLHWANAISFCSALVFGGYSDWRVPTQFEWMAAINHGIRAVGYKNTGTKRASGTTDNNDYFMALTEKQYWCSTTRSDTTNSFQVHTGTGQFLRAAKSDASTTSVMCVR
jgi:hypothetical protein